jgi:pyridoxal phosphate enzyme (YggS family)
LKDVSIQERWNLLQERVQKSCVASHRSASSVEIVAVSKKQSPESVLEAYAAGARCFGENYVQEALPKIERVLEAGVAPEIRWHFIGGLQSNKAKLVAHKFSLLHSLDRWSLAEAMEKARVRTGGTLSVLVEVNVAQEVTKSGVPEDGLRPLIERVSRDTGIDVRGLMVFPPWSEDPEGARRYFARARELFEEVASWRLPRVEMRELSMGVTGDFEVAIEEGATMIRIGTAIFGER